MKFSIAIETGIRKSAFGLVVPDVPGCFSAGDTVEQAFDNAREAIGSHLEILAEEGKDLPKTKPLSEWQADREYKGWTWGLLMSRWIASLDLPRRSTSQFPAGWDRTTDHHHVKVVL
jgi:predicted RNase H-like HicB family nuclease